MSAASDLGGSVSGLRHTKQRLCLGTCHLRFTFTYSDVHHSCREFEIINYILLFYSLFVITAQVIPVLSRILSELETKVRFCFVFFLRCCHSRVMRMLTVVVT